MATKSEAFDDSKSVANSPPSYDTISTSGLSEDFIKCRQPSIFSFLSTKHKRATVLSHIRDIVSTPAFTPSSIDSIINACASALPAAKFSDLLQTPNIEGHTALYWAIVNHQRETFSALARFISKFSSQGSSDLRLACMETSDHALFSQLNLQIIDAKDESLRRFLNCPPDDIEVLEGGQLDDHKFVVSFRIRMFQKRLRTIQELKCEFVARGRIWLFRFYKGTDWRWRVSFGLSSPSPPACPKASLLIEAHGRKGEPGREALPNKLHMVGTTFTETVVPSGPDQMKYTGKVVGEAFVNRWWPLGDWVMYDNPVYVDCNGTLHAKLEMTLKDH